MRALSSLLRTLSPVGWLALAAVALVTVTAVLGGFGFRWDPFDLDRRRLNRVEASAAVARADALARSAEAAAQAGQVGRLEATLQSVVALERATSRSLQDARTADDASVPLALDRVDRLRSHDRELCRIAPDLGGCASAPDPARDGDATL